MANGWTCLAQTLVEGFVTIKCHRFLQQSFENFSCRVTEKRNERTELIHVADCYRQNMLQVLPSNKPLTPCSLICVCVNLWHSVIQIRGKNGLIFEQKIFSQDHFFYLLKQIWQQIVTILYRRLNCFLFNLYNKFHKNINVCFYSDKIHNKLHNNRDTFMIPT